MLGRRSHRELIAVCLADDDRAGVLESLDHRCAVRRDVTLEDARPGGGPKSASADVVLYRNGHSGKSEMCQTVGSTVELRRALERTVRVDGNERVEFRIQRGNPVERRAAGLCGG